MEYEKAFSERLAKLRMKAGMSARDMSCALDVVLTPLNAFTLFLLGSEIRFWNVYSISSAQSEPHMGHGLGQEIGRCFNSPQAEGHPRRRSDRTRSHSVQPVGPPTSLAGTGLGSHLYPPSDPRILNRFPPTSLLYYRPPGVATRSPAPHIECP